MLRRFTLIHLLAWSIRPVIVGQMLDGGIQRPDGRFLGAAPENLVNEAVEQAHAGGGVGRFGLADVLDPALADIR
ncbi:hypothetical protein D3C86_1920590 [compost metagenome]